MEHKIKFFGNGDDIFKDEIHFVINKGVDYTLCGITLDSDVETAGDYEITNKKVNCANCQKIVYYCKLIKKTW